MTRDGRVQQDAKPSTTSTDTCKTLNPLPTPIQAPAKDQQADLHAPALPIHGDRAELLSGLRHELANLLMPLRIHLHALEQLHHGSEGHGHVVALQECERRLQQVVAQLRSPCAAPSAAQDSRGEIATAVVSIADPRARYLISSDLARRGVRVRHHADPPGDDVALWITDAADVHAIDRARAFVGGSRARHAVICAQSPPTTAPPSITILDLDCPIADVRSATRAAADTLGLPLPEATAPTGASPSPSSGGMP